MSPSDRVRATAFSAGWWLASVVALMAPTAGSRDVIADSWRTPVTGAAFALATVCALGATLTAPAVGDPSRVWTAVAAVGAVLTLVPVVTAIADDRVSSLFQDETPGSLVAAGYALMFVAWGGRRRAAIRSVPAGAVVGFIVAIAMSEAVWRTTFNDQGMVERTRTAAFLDDLWPVLGSQSVSVLVTVGSAWLVGVRRSSGVQGRDTLTA
ncbi:hypothetical protein WKY82_15640 [Gordonia malaquae]|uniref:hypothetical protein n=1 Tax=Gordonia malaquae TaxID=410332 RepID=UPI0030C797FD